MNADTTTEWPNHWPHEYDLTVYPQSGYEDCEQMCDGGWLESPAGGADKCDFC